MSTSRNRALAVAAGIVAVCVAYVLAKRLGLPMLWLDPEAMAWSFGARPTPLAMDFFGRGLFSLAAGALSWGVVRACSARLTLSPLVVRLGAVGVALALVACLSWEAARLMSLLPPSTPSVAQR